MGIGVEIRVLDPTEAYPARVPPRSRPARSAFVCAVGAALVGAACSGSTQASQSVACENGALACSCTIVSASQPGQTLACNQAAYPGTTCCADPGWPGSGTCGCSTNEVACGIVQNYFGPLFDGGPTAGCVCSPASYAQRGQVLGAACEPGGWADPASTVGVCCLYPANFPNQYGGATCACGPAFNCAPGSTKMDSCSAASFPAATPVSCSGGTEVTSCADGTADAGQGSDASQVAD